MSARRLQHADGIFRTLHGELVGPPLDLGDFDPKKYSPARIELARRVWQGRVQTEYRSVQIMLRFATEVIGAGDPLEVHTCAVDLALDEIRHVQICAQLVEALGAPALLPDPIELRDSEQFLRAPMAERAIATGISMLAINETISVAFVEDLRARCTDVAVKRVLDATVEDEEGHRELGWTYVTRSLERFPKEARADFRHLVATTLAPHREAAARAKAGRASDDAELAALGLFDPVRQADVFERCYQRELAPRLIELDLL